MTDGDVRSMERLYSGQMTPECCDHCRWEDGDPILAALATPHLDFPPLQIEVHRATCFGDQQVSYFTGDNSSCSPPVSGGGGDPECLYGTWQEWFYYADGEVVEHWWEFTCNEYQQ